MDFIHKKPFVIIVAILLLASFGTALAAEKTLYTCSMHPQIIRDEPGDCPICGMRLVKLDAARLGTKPSVKTDLPGEVSGTMVPAGYASVMIDPQKQQLIGIRTAGVRKKELEHSILTNARVAYDPDLYEAQIDYLREHRTAQSTLRNRELAFKNLQDSRWEAPRIDVARSKLLRMGMDEDSIQELVKSAKGDDSLLYLKPDGDVWVYAEVFESEALNLHKNDRVRLEVPASPGKVYEGMIHSIGSSVDPMSRRIHVHVKLKNDGSLKPEMFLNARIDSAAGEGLVVPEEAVFFTGTGNVVFVDKGQGLFEPRLVEVGIKTRDEYQILKGLDEGEKVVVNANFLLDSESRLKASFEEAVAEHAEHGSGS